MYASAQTRTKALWIRTFSIVGETSDFSPPRFSVTKFISSCHSMDTAGQVHGHEFYCPGCGYAMIGGIWRTVVCIDELALNQSNWINDVVYLEKNSTTKEKSEDEDFSKPSSNVTRSFLIWTTVLNIQPLLRNETYRRYSGKLTCLSADIGVELHQLSHHSARFC